MQRINTESRIKINIIEKKISCKRNGEKEKAQESRSLCGRGCAPPQPCVPALLVCWLLGYSWRRICSPPSLFSLFLSLSLASRRLGGLPPPALRQSPGAEAFAGDKQPPGIPTLSLPCLLCENDLPNSDLKLFWLLMPTNTLSTGSTPGS